MSRRHYLAKVFYINCVLLKLQLSAESRGFFCYLFFLLLLPAFLFSLKNVCYSFQVNSAISKLLSLPVIVNSESPDHPFLSVSHLSPVYFLEVLGDHPYILSPILDPSWEKSVCRKP